MSEDSRLSARAKLTILIVVGLLAIFFLLQIRAIIWPFLWAFVAAYLLTPVVNYLNVQGRLPRIWSVFLIYALFGLTLLAGSRYLYPRLVDQGTVFIEDIPRLEAALVSAVGPKPLGVDVTALINQVVDTVSGSTSNSSNASHLLVNALETVVKVFLFLVSTFYLLIDAPRLRAVLTGAIPGPYRYEITELGRRINSTWQQYIRGELLLFVLMFLATTIGLTILQVPGAVFLGLLSGALELLPLVGPITAGALAVSVAYFNGTNPWGWSQFAYAGAVALLYFVLRQAEDYFVVPNVLGRAVRLHPLVVLFAVTAGGVAGGLFGLIVAVPIAASIKEIWVYLYGKLLDLPAPYETVETVGGDIIEIPIHGEDSHDEDQPDKSGARPPES